MYISTRNILYICVILNFIPYVFSIKCWNCRSSNDPKCADPFDNSTVPITDCNQEKGLSHLPGIRPTMCRKVRQKVNDQWIVTRDCAGVNENYPFSSCLSSAELSQQGITLCETCDSHDGCNGAAALGKTILLLVGALALLLFK